MKSSDTSTDRIFTRPQFTIHYRRARRTRWTSDARPVYTILFLLDGRWKWKTEEAQNSIGWSSVLLAAPGESISTVGEGAISIALNIAPAFMLDCAVRSRLTRADSVITFRVRSAEGDEHLARLAGDLADELLEETAGQEVVIEAIVEQIIVHLLRRYANIRRSDEIELSRAGLVDRRIRRAVELMHLNLDRDLQLEELASAAYISPFHFARLFKKLTGITPHAYLAALRVARAQTLLTETDLSITEVGARVGYASSSHFAKAFRQATGLSPRAFRAALIREPLK